MASQYYHIEKFQDCILVTLRGSWNISTNIQYLSSLAEVLEARKGKKFRLLVDMRDWQVPSTPSAKRIKAAFHLDRRNQYAEIWLVNNATKSDDLEDKFFNHVSFSPKRAHTVKQFMDYVCNNDSNEQRAYILDWLERNSVDKQN